MPRTKFRGSAGSRNLKVTNDPVNTPQAPTILSLAAMVRYKARYLLFNILYPEEPSLLAAGSSAQAHIEFSSPTHASITPSVLGNLIRDCLAHQFGDWGVGVAGNLSVKYFSPQTSTGIVRVSRDHYRLVWTALSLMRELKGKPIVVRVVRVSGTIKKVEKEAIRRAKLDIRMAGSAAGGKAGALVEIEDIEDDDMED